MRQDAGNITLYGNVRILNIQLCNTRAHFKMKFTHLNSLDFKHPSSISFVQKLAGST